MKSELILTNPTVIKNLMERHGFTFTKSLGQNFLINPSVCPRMAAALTSKTVIEIGAGIGVLTRELAKAAEKVIVIEIDEGLKPILTETLSVCPNVEIIWGDVLKLDLAEIITSPVSVIANLPYYAATHIIIQLMESKLPINSLIVMVQEEVAQRFAALPGTKQYGSVSVATRFYSQPKTLFKVSRGSFMPAPKVDSAVIRFDLFAEKKYDVDENLFFRLVKAAFSERRKQMCNPVSKEFSESGISKETVKSALEETGKNPLSRAEELSVDEFAELYSVLMKGLST
ncbi:MAG: 16S rRNA (adenine(1518)-N(6)/adenine(1519)-N(6))-dimethyltransferase RsmA [Oscillospiraceae bacterium]|nr:16S rRNA (adenine(1518)-N(6)/adenine(1519)-N(6))-dimethyltransferase RsmA [Oscillospiraceae bacterium]